MMNLKKSRRKDSELGRTNRDKSQQGNKNNLAQGTLYPIMEVVYQRHHDADTRHARNASPAHSSVAIPKRDSQFPRLVSAQKE